MAQNRAEIQNRISSVTSTRKITNAMQLVASSKLSKMRSDMEKTLPYAQALEDLLYTVIQKAGTNTIYHQPLNEAADKPAFVFVITSDSGLCGGYNANVFRFAKEHLNKDDLICMVGSRGISWARQQKLDVYAALPNLNEDIAYTDLSKVMSQALKMYKEGKIRAIEIIYTRYKNAITFEPTLKTLVPLSDEAEKKKEEISAQTLFEPDKREMINQIVPMALKSRLYSSYMEAKTSEQASRRSAMETATDNADDLLEDLNLQSNRIRQAQITQEITEIVSGANALG